MPNGQGNSQQERIDGLIHIAKSEGIFFHTPEKVAFVTLPVGNHWETWSLRSQHFQLYLRQLGYTQLVFYPSSHMVNEIVGALEAYALFDGEQHTVHVRLAENNGKFYLDLGDADWNIVEITPQGWTMLQDSPVKFWRPKGLAPLPIPVPGRGLDKLRQFLNVGLNADLILVKAWLLAVLHPKGPYPVLVFIGPQGAAKSTTVRVLISLIDPKLTPLRVLPRSVQDLMILARNNWIVSFDNLSSIPPWLSDSLCQLSTGGGMSTRQLYTDAEEMLFEAQRPIVLNGIEEVVTRADLLDRSVVIELPIISGETRRSEEEFWQAFEAEKPALLGSLLDALVMGLQRKPTTNLPHKPRMADFALLATAAEPALGCQPGQFLKVYEDNRVATISLSLEMSPIPDRLIDYLDRTQGLFEGTAQTLLTNLEQVDGDWLLSPPHWPKRPQDFSNQLRRLEPVLQAQGIDIQRGRSTGKKRERLLTIRKRS